jgi:helix-turn-helix protein
MSNETLAKFRGTVAAEAPGWEEPRSGHVVLRREQLVLAADGEQFPIPLSAVFDVNTGSRPQTFGPVSGVPVTIAYDDGEGKRVAVIGAKAEYIEKFEPAVFKTILTDTWMSVKHPARRGGRVTDAAFQPALLSVSGRGVRFDTDDGAVRVDTAAVVGFGRQEQTVDGTDQVVLVVRHIADGSAVTTAAAADSTRTLSLLGRYLRRRYDELLAALSELSLSEPELEVLVTIYSTEEAGVAISDVLDVSSDRLSRILGSLHERSLVERAPDGPALTTMGRVVVNQYSGAGNT